MCKCTPSIRTPYCGKPGCEWPEKHPKELPRCDHGIPMGEQCPECCRQIFPPFEQALHAVAAMQAKGIEATLAARGALYGEFSTHALITQTLKEDMRQTKGWRRLTVDQAEALDMIVHKIGRILNGDPNYHDSWHDIVGYAKLVADRLEGATHD